MDTHQLAKALRAISSVLNDSPKIDLDDFIALLHEAAQHKRPQRTGELSIGIVALANLSKFSKNEWIDFIKAHELPVPYQTKDSSRNLIGKILKYLESRPLEIERVRSQMRRVSPSTSPELARAFSILLGDPKL